MSIVGRLIEGVRAIGRTRTAAPGGRQVRVRARYDAAQTTADNHRHWLLADGLSADAAASPAVRRTLRNRSRYEVANNSYARGIVLTLANDTVGTGARLQLLGLTSDEARQVERAFMDWARVVDLAEKMRVMRVAQVEDGEAFALLTTNPRLGTPAQLDLRLVEADQITTPMFAPVVSGGQMVDGIVFDGASNPVEYHLLRRHPGDTSGFSLGYDRVPAAAMVHLFRPDRPGQRRGVPELTPALPIFADLRRYCQAVIAAAETAADYAGIAYTDAPANGEADPVEPMDTIHLEKRSLLTMPGGWRMEQMRAEQPTTTYPQFVQAKLNEACRCLNMPFNIAAGNSSGYNYASGRLDHQTYYKAIRVDQSRIASLVLDRVFAAWVQEAVLVAGFLPARLRDPATDWSHQWFWDGHEHVDPLKEANAQAKRLESHTTTLADEYARKGQDWETQMRQRARELALMRELGLGLPADPAAPAAPTTPPAQDPADAPNPDAGDDVDARAA
ncbi:MAG: phage portal protein [Planctomycetes bacterium]|nr:phage portal protein [Planctomycetota bacterium]